MTERAEMLADRLYHKKRYIQELKQVICKHNAQIEAIQDYILIDTKELAAQEAEYSKLINELSFESGKEEP